MSPHFRNKPGKVGSNRHEQRWLIEAETPKFSSPIHEDRHRHRIGDDVGTGPSSPNAYVEIRERQVRGIWVRLGRRAWCSPSQISR